MDEKDKLNLLRQKIDSADAYSLFLQHAHSRCGLADALDRWRLGSKELDPRFLRTLPPKKMTDYSHSIVLETISSEHLEDIEKEVERIIQENS